MHQPNVKHMMIVPKNIHAMEMYARQRAEVIRIVWPMNDVFEVIVELFVIVIHPVAKGLFVKIDCAKLDVAMTLCVAIMRHALTINAKVILYFVFRENLRFLFKNYNL